MPTGVEIIDTLHCTLPFNVIGELVHQIVVKNKVNEVFDYRYETL